jgi:hypothetical protein
MRMTMSFSTVLAASRARLSFLSFHKDTLGDLLLVGVAVLLDPIFIPWWLSFNCRH